MLDVVELREEPSGVGRPEAMEFIAGLLAEVGPVYEKENAARVRVLDKAVAEGARGVGLPRTGGHVDETTRPTLRE